MLRGIQPKETKNNLKKIIKTAQNKNIKVIIRLIIISILQRTQIMWIYFMKNIDI